MTPTRFCIVAVSLLLFGLSAASAVADAGDDPLPPDAIARFGPMQLLHPAQVESLAFAPDGKTFAAGDYGGCVRLWDAHTGALRWEPRPSNGPTVAFSPDGRTLAAGGPGRAVHLWGMVDHRVGRQLRSTSGGIWAFTSDGRGLLCAEPSSTKENMVVRLIDVGADAE